MAEDWQPIETAPRDGTWILIWVPFNQAVTSERGDQTVAQFHVGYDGDAGDHERLRWRERGGFYNIIATHWKPLGPPPPPERHMTDDELLALARKIAAEYEIAGPVFPYDFDRLNLARAHIALIERRNAEVERLTRERDEAIEDYNDSVSNADHYHARAKAAESALAAAQKRSAELEGAVAELMKAATFLTAAKVNPRVWTGAEKRFITAMDQARVALAGKEKVNEPPKS